MLKIGEWLLPGRRKTEEQEMKMKLFMVVLLIAGLSACGKKPVTINSTDIKSFKNFVVRLEPKPADNTVKVKSKAQGWKKGGKKDGYVGYDIDDAGMTFFAIKKENWGDFCEKKDESGTAKWVITKLLLSATGDPATEKGNNFGNSQEAYPWLKKAFPNVKLINGELFNKSKDQGVTFLPVFNANGHSAKDLGEKFIYYQLTLSECKKDGKVLTTDPGWKNGGRN
jgi:hypothetical protein